MGNNRYEQDTQQGEFKKQSLGNLPSHARLILRNHLASSAPSPANFEIAASKPSAGKGTPVLEMQTIWEAELSGSHFRARHPNLKLPT